MKINVWNLMIIFLYTFFLVSFYKSVQTFFKRIKTTKFDVLIRSEEFKNQRYGDFKNIENIITIKSYDEPYTFNGGQTIDFVGCCLERQTLVTYLFEQKQIDNPFQILELNEVFLTGECDVFVNETIYQFCRFFYDKLQIVPFPAGELIYFDHALHVYMSKPFQLGNFILETLSVISLYPQEIIKKSTLILSEIKPFVLDSLALFGLKENQMHVKTHDEEIYFVHHLYTILPHQCTKLNPESMKTLRSYLVKMFDLDQKPPSQFVLFTFKNEPNELMNYESVLSKFNSTYPKIKWNIDPQPKNFSSLITFYNDVKLLFACTSKNLILSIMMQKGTVFCEIQGNIFDPLALHISAYLGHHHILARIPGMMLEDNEDPYELPLSTALGMLKIALIYLNYTML